MGVDWGGLGRVWILGCVVGRIVGMQIIEQGGQGVGGDPSMEDFQAKLRKSEETQRGFNVAREITSQAEVPDIRMQMDFDDPRAQQALMEMLEKAGLPVGERGEKTDRDLFYAESQYLALHKDLEKLAKEKEDVKKQEIRERLKVSKERLM